MSVLHTPLSSADQKRTLLRPSLVHQYKDQEMDDDASEPESTIEVEPVSRDTFIPDPAGGAKGKCRLCLKDDTVTQEQKAILRTRSAHKTHVKRGEDPMSDSTFHSPRRRLLRLLASMGMALKTGEAKGESLTLKLV